MKKLNTKHLSILIIAFLIIDSASSQTADIYANLYKDLPFKMERVKQPVFNEFTVNIKDFGAKSDGITSNTKFIANAIDAVVKKGGGTIVIPEGTWLTGPIVLKSNVRIHTLKGALIVFSKDKSEYPLVNTWYEGLQSWRCMSPIYAEKADNIAITGEGIFDGSGEAWRPVKKMLMTSQEWKQTTEKGGVIVPDGKLWYPDSSAYHGSMLGSPRPVKNIEEAERIKTFLRPVMLNFVLCTKILIEGATFQNTPSWCLHPVMCSDLTIVNVKTFNEDWAVNGDALDLESCKNVIVYNCLFDAGDDGICIKSGRNEEGRKRGMPTENVIVSGCTVYSGHGGFVIGSEMSGGARNIKVSHCTFMGTDNGLRFKSTRGRGGIVENIYISDINMVNIVDDAILFDLYYFVKERTSDIKVADETTPQFRNMYIRDVVCKGAHRAILLQGLPEMNLQNIQLENITIESETGMYCSDASDIKIKNLTMLSKALPAIKIDNAKDLVLENLNLNSSNPNSIQIDGSKTSQVSISGTGISSSVVAIGSLVDKKEVSISK